MNNPTIIRSGFVRATVGLFGNYRAKLKVLNHLDNPIPLIAELVYTGNQFESLGIEASCIVCDPSDYPAHPRLTHFGLEMPVLTAQHAILPLFAKLLYSHLRLVGLGSHIALEQAYLIARDMLRSQENG